jgi:hypothetical protein
MVQTRQEVRHSVYKHLIEVIFGFEADHPIPKSLAAESADSIPGIISLREKDLVDLGYKSVDADDVEHILLLGKGQQHLLAIVPLFILYKQ